MSRRARTLLALDGGAAGVVGVAELALLDRLPRWLGFPPTLVLLFALANVAYAAYSGTLAVRAACGRAPALLAITVLVAANALWALVCMAVVVAMGSRASALGVALVSAEGLFVAALAALEWRWVRPLGR